MKLHLIGLLAALVLVVARAPFPLASDVAALEQSPIRSGLLSPLRSTLRSLRNLVQPTSSSVRQSGTRDEAAAESLREQTYKMFMRAYNKTYSSTSELRHRMDLFFKRHQTIERSQREFAEGRATFTMRENQFGDLEESEIKKLAGVEPPKRLDELLPSERAALAAVVKKQRLRRRRRSVEQEVELEAVQSDLNLSNDTWYELIDFDGDELDEPEDSGQDDDPGLSVRAPESIPASKDWRQSGCIAQPINQMMCGCCYAIATMDTISSMRCLLTGSSATLSPQHIVDCSTPRAGYQNFGCRGGWPTRVLKYLQDTRVAVRDRCYPFVRRQGTCLLRQMSQYAGCTLNASPTDARLTYKVLNNEQDILYHVANTGPVITVMKSTEKFLFYSNGIFDDSSCSRRRNDVDHAIVIVGYGQENGIDYWLIKNSWGIREWGDMGYGKYRRGSNACSIGHWGWVITS